MRAPRPREEGTHSYAFTVFTAARRAACSSGLLRKCALLPQGRSIGYGHGADALTARHGARAPATGAQWCLVSQVKLLIAIRAPHPSTPRAAHSAMGTARSGPPVHDGAGLAEQSGVAGGGRQRHRACLRG